MLYITMICIFLTGNPSFNEVLTGKVIVKSCHKYDDEQCINFSTANYEVYVSYRKGSKNRDEIKKVYIRNKADRETLYSNCVISKKDREKIIQRALNLCE